MPKDGHMVSLEVLEKERKKWKGRLKEMEEKMTNAEEVIVTEEVGGSGNTDYLEELAELMQKPFYADSGNYVKEMKAYADKHNVSLKEAYNALFAEKKYEEVRQQAENEMQSAVLARQNRKIEAVNGPSGAPKVRAKLSKEQLRMAEMCGMTAEEYLKYS